MKNYCLGCKKHTDDMGSKKVIITNKIIRYASECSYCAAENSRFLKQKSN